MKEFRTFDFRVSLRPDSTIDGIVVKPGVVATPLFVVIHRGDWRVRVESSGFLLETPGFPDGPACRIQGDASSFEVVTDHSGIATAFWTDRTLPAGTGTVASTRLADVEVGDRNINGHALEEIGLLGHVLGNGTAVEGIHRTSASTCFTWSESKGARAQSSPIPNLLDLEPNSSIDAFIEGVGSLGESGESIELTGGLDSRVLLALRILTGRKPRLAITFGQPSDPDVHLASSLATAFGIHHEIISFGGNYPALAQSSAFNAAQAGGITDVKRYASFLPAFDRLASEREEQIGGAGGEIAIDFYNVPGLTAMAGRGSWMPLIRRRMIQVPRLEADLGATGRAEAIDRVATSVRDILNGYEDSDVLQRLRRFYFQERLANWAGPVLNANRYEYTPLTPLLHSCHVAWANSLSSDQRNGRRGQENLLRDLVDRYGLDKVILEIPFAGPRRGVRKLASWGWKFLRKLRERTLGAACPVVRCLIPGKPIRIRSGSSGDSQALQLFGQDVSAGGVDEDE